MEEQQKQLEDQQARMEEQQWMLEAQCKLMEDQKQALLGMQSQMALMSSLLSHPLELHDSKKWIVVGTYHFGCFDILEIWIVFCWAHLLIRFLFWVPNMIFTNLESFSRVVNFVNNSSYSNRVMVEAFASIYFMFDSVLVMLWHYKRYKLWQGCWVVKSMFIIGNHLLL